ncbi:D-alanine-D-alanine ligase [Bradyrhizobium diazoefficiens]
MTNERRKITVGLLFGGRSAEHEVSRASAANILRALNSDRYDVYLIGISRDGRWFACDSGNGAGTGSTALTISDEAPEIGLVPGGRGRLVHCDGPTGSDAGSIDVAFPILHGPNGEDGTVQGALELADVSFVGSSVTGSAVAMDKEVSKRLMRDAGLPVVPFLTTTASSRIEYAAAVAALGTSDLFVKPANLGSSVGVSRARSEEEFAASCALAFRYDRKILVEQALNGAREIECSVLEESTGDIRASGLGEIVPASEHGFYSYQAKYIDADGAALHIPADLPLLQARRLQELAVEVFNVLCCEGMARVDFFVQGDEVFVNEANTLPGFTWSSMYPKLWEASGLSQTDLMDKLIAHAFARHERRRALSFG